MPKQTGTIKTVQEVVHERILECRDKALEQFSRAILPIYGSTDTGEPIHLASCILIKSDDEPLMLTAAHNIDLNRGTTLYTGTSTLEPISLTFAATRAPRGNRSKDRYDFAIARISNDLASKLGTARYVTEGEISRSVGATSGHLYTCLAYPNSENTEFDREHRLVTPQLLSYSSTAISPPPKLLRKLKVSGEDHLFIDYKGHSRDEVGNRIRSISLLGFSGGGVIDLGNLASRKNLMGECKPLLAGLFIEFHYKHKAAVATHLSTILHALRGEEWPEAVPDRSSSRGVPTR